MVQQAPFVKPHYVLIVAAATVLLIARRSVHLLDKIYRILIDFAG